MNSLITLLETAEPLQFVTYVTFMITFMGMAAGSFFFALERGSMPERYREGMSVTALILAIASINYFYMQGIYRESVLSGDTTFPTVFRYIDWFLTTPLMLLKFPLMLGLGKKGQSFLMKLVFLDLGMIGFAFAGELQETNLQLHYGFFAIACLCWATIVYMLNSALQQLPEWIPDATRTCVRVMGKFIFFGWMIYPIGYLLPSFAPVPEMRELLYNIGDLINKVGLGMVVYAAALATRHELETAHETPDETE